MKLGRTRAGTLVLAAALALGACSDNPVSPDTITPAPPPTTIPAAGGYSITLRYLGPITPRQQQAVTSAVARWQSVITRDLPDVNLNVPAGACFETQPAINERIDDLLIFVEFADIDGPGKVLGEAGPCYIRGESSLPLVGQLRLDAADLAMMEAQGTLDDVVLHEIGHVLGIGTLWADRKLVMGSGGADPQFVGSSTVAAYRAMGGGAQSTVPVENTGAAGTRDGHWRESVFGNELMTGWIGIGGNPMSALTIASLEDLGYTANQSAASPYTINRLFASTQSSQSDSRVRYINLHGQEKIKRPKFRVDRHGRVHQ